MGTALTPESDNKTENSYYTMDELFGILKDSDGLSYDEMREEYLKNKYQLSYATASVSQRYRKRRPTEPLT